MCKELLELNAMYPEFKDGLLKVTTLNSFALIMFSEIEVSL